MTKQAERAGIEIKHLAIGQKFELSGFNGATGFVKRVARNDYALFDNANGERSCWGDLAEITQDVAFFVDNGQLRAPLGERW